MGFFLFNKIQTFLKKIKNSLKYATIASPLFEELGINYIGIIDGNDTEDVIAAIEKAFQEGGDYLRNAGIHVESLAIIESLDNCEIKLK